MFMRLTSLIVFSVCLLVLFPSSAAMAQENYGKKLKELKKKLVQLNLKYSDLQKRVGTRGIPLFDVASVCEGRLTTQTGTPLSTTDQSSKSTLYFTPYFGAAIALYDGSIWELISFSEKSIALAALSAGSNYDVFGYSNAGTLTLELSSAWADNTTRTDALALQNGIYVKSADHTRRFLGTIRASAATTTEDTKTQRFVWNMCNRRPRHLLITDSTDNWTYSSTSWRAANNSASNKVEYVVGMNDHHVNARTIAIATAAPASGNLNYASSGVGVDSATVNSSTLRGSGVADSTKTQVLSEYADYPGIGYHYLQWLEASHATGITFYGDNGDGTKFQSGMFAEIYN